MVFHEIKKRLSGLETSSLADADKSLRVLDPAIRPVCSGLCMVGIARTVSCNEDFLTVIKALDDAQANEVLVINTNDSRAAVTGELFATEAKRKGLAGIVVDGACRDSAGIRKLGFPVYSRSIIPVAGTTRGIFETQTTIQCAGVRVEPGDIVFGDDDGVIIASEAELNELIIAAENIQQTEQRILKRMAAGESLLDMLNFHDYWNNIQSGKPGKLEFKP